MTNPKDSSVKAAKPSVVDPAKEDQAEVAAEEKTTDGSITVVVHPLVLLSVVDHFNRMGKIGNQKRVVGVLLGKINYICWLSLDSSCVIMIGGSLNLKVL